MQISLSSFIMKLAVDRLVGEELLFASRSYNGCGYRKVIIMEKCKFANFLCLEVSSKPDERNSALPHIDCCFVWVFAIFLPGLYIGVLLKNSN